ncbi:hypothetical protein B0H10DRAFT_1963718 [Mycena sp. CBHHK59/15]|nr:hypothetical protein B0H10DRAFT_1963718 [Mycena sp. CBHHK59/15]
MEDSQPTLDAMIHAINSREWMDHTLCASCSLAKLWPFQLELSMDVNGGRDIFVVIATGMGKTVVLQSGAIAAQAWGEKGVALLIVPTKALVKQQADVASHRGLCTLAINQWDDVFLYLEKRGNSMGDSEMIAADHLAWWLGKNRGIEVELEGSWQ